MKFCHAGIKPPENKPDSNTPSTSISKSHHIPAKPFAPATQPTQETQKSSENFSGHTPAQSFTPTAPAIQQTQSNIVKGVDRTTPIGDLISIKGSHHVPEKAFTPATEPKPAPAPTPPAPEPPKE